MKIGLVGPVTVEVFIGLCPVSVSMDGVLIGTGSNLKTEIEQSPGVMLSVPGRFSIGQGKKGSRESMGSILDENLVVISLVRF